MTHTRVATLLVVMVCAAASAQEAVDLAPNPSFEVADGDLPAFWEPRTPTDARRDMIWADGVAHSGERSVSIFNHAGVSSRWRFGHERDLGMTARSQVVLSAWVRTDAARAGAHLQLYAIDARGEILRQPMSPALTGTNDWTRVSVRMAVPDEPCYVMGYLGMRGPGQVWFDDVELLGVPGPAPPAKSEPVVCTAREFEELDGYEVVTRSGREVLQPPEGLARAEATAIFWEGSARYDLTLLYIDEPDGDSTFRVLVNGVERGSVVADENDDVATGADQVHEYTIPDVDLQRLSRITIIGEPDQGERARIHALRFQRTGRYQGKLLTVKELPMPDNLRVYQTPRERRHARTAIARYAYGFIKERDDALRAEADALKTAEDVRAWQADIRSRLGEFFGRWPAPTPLNPRTVGTIELDFCTIEKVIIETEPGYFVPLNFYIPKDATLPAPAVCITMGHAAEGKGYHLYHEFALGLAHKGYIACAFDPMGQGERRSFADPPEELGREGGPVGQHHYALRAGFLVGRSLSGLRTWDGVRVIDYMLSRPEVDPGRVAVGGNSGGGQMTLLLTACHPRVKCCAAAHPGGSCENTHYRSKHDIDLRLIALIPPRPCRWIVGADSGEEIAHRSRHDWLQRFYGLLGSPEANDFRLVNGVHDLKLPKREAAYGWYNRWLGVDVSTIEDPLEPLTAEQLWCTETGLVETSLHGESERSIDARLMREMAPARPEPAADPAEREAFLAQRRATVLDKLAVDPGLARPLPSAREVGTCEHDALDIEKLAISTEEGVEVAALLLRPKSGASGPVFICASGDGKPAKLDDGSLPFALALAGHAVLAVDVRGVGELDAKMGARGRVVEYDREQWARDGYAIALAGADKTMAGPRALDLIGCIDYLDDREDVAGRYVLVGEGIGGLWALAAGIADERVAGVATVGMLASYRMILDNKWNNLRDYFWVPRALEAYDLPDLPALMAPHPVALINTVDQMLHPLPDAEARVEFAWARMYFDAAGSGDALSIEADVSPGRVAKMIEEMVR